MNRFQQTQQSSRTSLTAAVATNRRLRFSIWQPLLLLLLALALTTSTVSAAIIEVNMTSSQVAKEVRSQMRTLKPALHESVDDVSAEALAIGLSENFFSAEEHDLFYQAFVEGKAPEGYPEVAYMLGLSNVQVTSYSLMRLEEEGLLTYEEITWFQALLEADNEEVRQMAIDGLESGEMGPMATAILLPAVMLSAIPNDSDIQPCQTSSGDVHAEGFFSWLGGLVKAVVGGALKGALMGFIFGGGWQGALAGAIQGGIRGGIGYIANSVNGFMAGPNGEDCQGWPAPYPSF